MGGGVQVVCGVDIGSTNTKVVAVDRVGQVRLRASMPTRRLDGDLLDAMDLLAAIEGMLLRVAEKGHVIEAVCVAGIGEDGLLVGEHLEPLCPVLPWFHPERTSILQHLHGALPETADLPVATDAARTLVGWRWARNRPGVEEARSWVALTDWAAAYWTGRAFMSDTLAARTSAWLPRQRVWAADRVRATLGDEWLLPHVVAAGTVLGALRSPTLHAAGALAPDAVVVAGGHDHPVGGWAVQQLCPRAVVDSMGTAEVVVTQSRRPDLLRTAIVDVAPGILGPAWSVLSVQELARNVDWASRDPRVMLELARLVSGEAQPTEHLHSDAFRPGGQGGGEPSYAPGTPTDPRARASAVLGSLARHGGELIAAVSDTLDADAVVYATGGWARSPGWMAIKQTMTRRPCHLIREPEVTAVAACLLAGDALGWDIPARRALAGKDAQAPD